MDPDPVSSTGRAEAGLERVAQRVQARVERGGGRATGRWRHAASPAWAARPGPSRPVEPRLHERRHGGGGATRRAAAARRRRGRPRAWPCRTRASAAGSRRGVRSGGSGASSSPMPVTSAAACSPMKNGTSAPSRAPMAARTPRPARSPRRSPRAAGPSRRPCCRPPGRRPSGCAWRARPGARAARRGRGRPGRSRNARIARAAPGCRRRGSRDRRWSGRPGGRAPATVTASVSASPRRRNTDTSSW